MLINNLDINRKDRFKRVSNKSESIEIYSIVFVWMKKIDDKARYSLLLYSHGRLREFVSRSKHTRLLINAYIFI